MEIIKKVFYWVNNDFLSAVFNWQSLVAIIVLGFVIILIAICTFRFTKNTNQKAKCLLDEFRHNGKYIDGLFIELDESKELLRCFSLGKKLKKKIIRDHNEYIKNQRLTVIAKKEKYSFRIPRFSTERKIMEKIDENTQFLKTVSNKHDDFSFYADSSKREYEDLLSILRKKLILFKAGTSILIGNAGNGKTTLLCNVAQMLINYKCPCTFVNSRDVHSTLKNHIVDLFSFPVWIKNKHLTKAMVMLNVLLCVSRKYYVIIVDAVNENDKDVFSDSISEFCGWISKYKHIKVIFSCRSEYYRARYKSRFKDVEPSPIEVKVANSFISERTKNNVLSVYKKYYNYSGNISEDSRQRLFKSMLLMRLFFEVNEGKDNDTTQLYNHLIYYNYIQRIDNKLTQVNLTDILDNVSDIMIENLSFDSVKISKLNTPLADINKILDNNLVLSKTILENEGYIHQTETTVISFTFDEIRDYYIARRLMAICEEKQDFSKMFDICSHLYDNILSPTEGVIRYCYFHLFEKGFYDVSKELLKKFNSFDQEYSYRNSDRLFNTTYTDFGLSIIMECPREREFLDYEKKYILKTINCRPISLIELLYNLTYNEVNGYFPDVTVLLDSLQNAKTSIPQIKHYLSMEFDSAYYSYEPNSDAYRSYTDYLIMNKTAIDENTNLKTLIILLAALYSNGSEFHDLIMQDDSYSNILQDLITRCNNTILHQELEKLKTEIEADKVALHDGMLNILDFISDNFE